MTYIKLEDVQKIILSRPLQELYQWFLKEINSLPSINPEEMIEEMIEKYNWNKEYQVDSDYYKISVLKELLQKFNLIYYLWNRN